MRPKEQVQSCAGVGPGSGPGLGDPAAGTPAPPPGASPASAPSAEPEPTPAPAPGTPGPRTASRAASGSRSGTRPASQAGPKAGAPRAAGRTGPDNSDAPWTRSVFQGPFGPRATGLGTGKAEGIWRTPAAYIGRRPGVSGPERAAFIRELQEALCPNLPPAKTITKDDIKEMVYLLEEKERDLNTAARIGQSLVKQNSVLMEENSKLEAMLCSAREEILHLRRQVNLRDDLLQLYSDSDDEEDEEEEEEEEHEGDLDPQHDHPYGAPKQPPQEESLHHCPQLEALEQKLRLLEEENDQLREEASHLDTLEDEEQMLILECVEQFSEASQQMAELSEVLVLRMENYERQQKEITQLQAQIEKLQQRCQSYGTETEKLQQQLASEKGVHMQFPAEQCQRMGPQTQNLRVKVIDCGGRPHLYHEVAKSLCQHSSMPVTHYTYSMPLEALPSFQETLAEELRTSLRRIISDPEYFVERGDREQEHGVMPPPEDLMPPEEFEPPEELVPEEELGAIEEVGTAEEGLAEEAEVASEETEAWEELEPELDEATRMNVVTSALEASGLGPSHLDMKCVLQQLSNWQDAHHRRQLKQKKVQKGCAVSQQPAEISQTA